MKAVDRDVKERNWRGNATLRRQVWMTALGCAVRARRRALKLTQDQVGTRVGVHRSYVSGIESGVRYPHLDVLDRLALALDTQASALIQAAEAALPTELRCESAA